MNTQELLPAKFKDTEDREWRLEFNFANAKVLRDEAGFDIGDMREGRAFAELAFDPFRLGQVLWILCEKQAVKLAVDEYAFAEGLKGETLLGVMQALEEAVVNFTPPHLRQTVREILEMSAEAVEESGKAVAAGLRERKPKMMAAMQKEVSRRLDATT